MYKSMQIPWGNPHILLSFVNTKLRDEYSNLQLLCDDYSCDMEKLANVLGGIGYYYNPKTNQFVPKEA